MDWFNFQDITFLCFFIIAVLLVVLALFLIISYGCANSSEFKYNRMIRSQSNTVRIFTINVKNNSVIYFNRSDLRKKKKIDLNTFYLQFHSNDVDKIKSWILSICMDPKVAEPYLEADVLLEHEKAPYFSLLKLLKYDPEIGVIHIESHVLKYITPTNFINRKHKNSVIGVVKRSTMESLILNEKGLKGFTFAVRFFYVKHKILSNDKIERYTIMTLKNQIYPFANNLKLPRQILDGGENELLLFDLRISNRDDAMRLATSFSHSIKKAIGVNGFTDAVNFSIGIIENSQFYQDLDSMILRAQEAAMSAQQNGQEIFLYQKQAQPLIELEKYKIEVENLMKPNRVRYLFRPIIDVSKRRTLGYFEYVRAYDSPFTSFYEMSRYAAKVGKNRELFGMIARYVIPKFASEKQNDYVRLFLTVALSDIDHLCDILPQVPHVKEVKVVLVFDEQEINENSSQIELLNNVFDELRKDKFEFALMLKDKNLLLDPLIYTNFHYFVAGASMIGEIKKNNRTRLSIYTLIEQLLKYKKPIIATDLEGWQSIELIIKSGVTIVSSETISASNDMLLPPERKKLDKLATMDDNFR